MYNLRNLFINLGNNNLGTNWMNFQNLRDGFKKISKLEYLELSL